jgi:hypothetical protein
LETFPGLVSGIDNSWPGFQLRFSIMLELQDSLRIHRSLPHGAPIELDSSSHSEFLGLEIAAS